MDLFKQNNMRECTKLDYADSNIHHSKDRCNEGNMLRRLSRRRLKHKLKNKLKHGIEREW